MFKNHFLGVIYFISFRGKKKHTSSIAKTKKHQHSSESDAGGLVWNLSQPTKKHHHHWTPCKGSSVAHVVWTTHVEVQPTKADKKKLTTRVKGRASKKNTWWRIIPLSKWLAKWVNQTIYAFILIRNWNNPAY